MAARRKVHVILTKYFMCINWGHNVIYLQNMKFEWLIVWPGGAYTDAMHILIHESWLHRLIGKYPKWAKNCNFNHIGHKCMIPSVWVAPEHMYNCAKYESSKSNHVGRRGK